jgi:hypothetical protein
VILSRALSIAAKWGIAVPVVIEAANRFETWIGVMPSARSDYYGLLLITMVWPSGLPFAAVTATTPWFSFQYFVLFLLVVAFNVGVYCLLGFLIWFGLNRFRPALFLAGGLVFAFWVMLWRLP